MNNYVEELKLLENERVFKIVKSAREQFALKGIIGSKLKDIAKNAKVGEATLYRHFKDKAELAKLVAFDYWVEESTFLTEYMEVKFVGNLTGLQKVIVFLQIFKESYVNHRPFLKFLEDFDNFMMRFDNHNVPSSFEEMILEIKGIFIEFVHEGVKDKSIREDVVDEELYGFVSQVMISTIQQLAIRTGYLQSDNGLDTIKLLDNLIEMFVCFIKNSE